MLANIFLDFNLPNAATWFYFSLLIAVALFVKFSRLLSVRNWDILTLFLLVPGFLLIQEADQRAQAKAREKATAVAGLVAAPQPLLLGPQFAALPPDGPDTLRLTGYLWLVVGSGYFLFRCIFDMALERRPALSPNLNLAGMAWLAGTFLICLVAVAVRPSPNPRAATVGHPSTVIDAASRGATVPVQLLAGADPADDGVTRVWVERGLAIGCHLALVAALILIGAIHFQDTTAGMATATLYLLLPYTAFHVAEAHHVWPTALILWAVYAYRRPWLSGLLLGLAAGSVFFPVLTLPIWMSFYRRRGAGRFLGMFLLAALASLGVAALVLWWDGELARSLQLTLSTPEWQPWKRTTAEGVWRGVHWAYRLPVFIAYMAFVLTTAFWPTPKNLAHLLALTAAVLVGTQFWYAEQGGRYVLWYLPLLLLLVFRPNLSDRLPPPVPPGVPRLVRFGRKLFDLTLRFVRPPEPLVRAR